MGRGAQSVVYKGLDQTTNQVVALKYISQNKNKKKQRNVSIGEMELLRKFSHPNIVKVLDIVENENAQTFVLEFMDNGSLASYVKKWGAFPEELVLKYLYQALKGDHMCFIRNECELNVFFGSESFFFVLV